MMELLFLRHFITELIGIVPAELQKEVTLMPDDVRVHYNSSKPAQFQTLAYNQGKDIYVAPERERRIPHDAWHMVQQKQRSVHWIILPQQENESFLVWNN